MSYKLPKAKRQLKMRVFRDQLHKKGYRMIGFGAFATVFGKSDSDRVVKVGYGYDPYLKYVQEIGLKSPNPYFPRIYKVEIFKDEHGFASFYSVTMERLKNWDTVRDRETIIASYKPLGIARFNDLQYLPAIKPKTKVAKQVKAVLKKVYRGGTLPDCHRGNIMWRKKGRKNQMVITDPVA